METIGLIGGASGHDLTAELQKKNYRVAIVAGQSDEPGMELAEHSLAVDLSRKEDIYDFFKEHHVGHVLLGTGHILAFQAAAYLETKGIKLSVNVKASFGAKDKEAFKQQLNHWGMLTPQAVVVHDAGDDSIREVIQNVSLPCVVKSCFDKLYPQKASNQDELRAALEEVVAAEDKVLCEQFISGVDTTIAVAADGEKVRACAVNYYSKANEVRLKGFGRFEQHKLSEEGEQIVKSTVEKAAKLAGFIGLPRFDTMVTKDHKVYILECNSVGVTGINPRYQAYADQFLLGDGINYARLLVETALTYWGLKQTNE